MTILKNVLFVLAFYVLLALPGLIDAWLATIPYSGLICFIVFAVLFLTFLYKVLGLGGDKK